MQTTAPYLIPVAQIDDNPFQTRTLYPEIEALAGDILANGLLQPPTGRLVWESAATPRTVVDQHIESAAGVAAWLEQGARVELAFGHRRLRAFRHLGFPTLPVFIKQLDDEAMARHAWTENAQRKDLTAIEEAGALQRMIERFGWTQEQAGAHVGLSRSAVANKLRLLHLPGSVRKAVQERSLGERHARTLLRLLPAGDEHVERLAAAAVEESWSADRLGREVEEAIASAVPVPEGETITTKNAYGMEIDVDPRWPLDWAPPPGHDAIMGRCTGCAHLLYFTGETFARCGRTTCWEAKRKLWEALEIERQYAAAAAAFEAQTGHPIARSEMDSWKLNIFGEDYNAPAGLLEKNLCNPADCPCMRLVHRKTSSGYHFRDGVRPDPEAAPNIFLACESSHRLVHRFNALKELRAAGGDPARLEEKKQAQREAEARAQAQSDAARAQLAAWYEEHGWFALAKSRPFMARAVHVSYIPLDDGDCLDTIWDKLFWRVMEKECFWWDAGQRVWRQDRVTEWLANLSQPSSRPPQPGPGDSQRTAWEEGWDGDDEDDLES